MMGRTMWRWGIVPLLAALLLAGFGASAGAWANGTPAATPEGTPGATPGTMNPLDEVEPEDLYAALLVAAVPADVLPPAAAPPSLFP